MGGGVQGSVCDICTIQLRSEWPEGDRLEEDMCAHLCVFGAPEVHVETRCLSCIGLHSRKGELLGFPAKRDKTCTFYAPRQKKKAHVLRPLMASFCKNTSHFCNCGSAVATICSHFFSLRVLCRL